MGHEPRRARPRRCLPRRSGARSAAPATPGCCPSPTPPPRPARRAPTARRAPAQSCRHLQSLDLGGCKHRITDAGLLAIAKHCAGLRSINLRFCELVTNVGVRAVQHACVNVQVRR